MMLHPLLSPGTAKKAASRRRRERVQSQTILQRHTPCMHILLRAHAAAHTAASWRVCLPDFQFVWRPEFRRPLPRTIPLNGVVVPSVCFVRNVTLGVESVLYLSASNRTIYTMFSLYGGAAARAT